MSSPHAVHPSHDRVSQRKDYTRSEKFRFTEARQGTAIVNRFMDSGTIPCMKLAELARVLGVTCHGDPDQEITGVEGIERAGPGQLTFVANPKYTPFARTTKAGAVLVTEDFPQIEAATLRTANPYLAFARAIDVFRPAPLYPPGIHPTAVIDPSATIGEDAHIGAYVVIGSGVVIGPNATLLPHVVIYPKAHIGKHFFAHAHAVVREECRLGDDVILQNGAVVGSDGFGFAKDDSGVWHKITQSGAVLIGNRVEIQANSCIDRASVGNTEIANGVKVDNLVQVGHGSTVGDDTLICSQVGLAGSSGVGKNVVLAGQVGVVGHSFIGDGVVVTAQSGVPGDVAPGSVISGSPAFEHRAWMRSVAAFRRLPELVKQVHKKP